jgi:hypothetical protein
MTDIEVMFVTLHLYSVYVIVGVEHQLDYISFQIHSLPCDTVLTELQTAARRMHRSLEVTDKKYKLSITWTPPGVCFKKPLMQLVAR